jgi:SH3-like domain-containing protein
MGGCRLSATRSKNQAAAPGDCVAAITPRQYPHIQLQHTPEEVLVMIMRLPRAVRGVDRRACRPLRIRLLVLLCVLCTPLGRQPASAREFEATYRVVFVAPDDVLNIRAGPAAAYPVIGIIPPDGRGLRRARRCRVWCRISYRGVSGWVNAHYLAGEAADEGPKLLTSKRQARALPDYWRVIGIAEGERLRVHDRPSASASVVYAFDPHTACIRLAGGCQKPWCGVAIPGAGRDRIGWVDSKHLAPSAAVCRN